jgi:hypothetical protein
MSAHGGKSAEQCRKRDDDSQETGQRTHSIADNALLIYSATLA